MHDDGKRDKRLPRPAAEAVDGERKLGLEEDELGRDRLDLLPGPEAEEREPHAREDPGGADASLLLDVAPGTGQAVVVGG